MSNIDTNFKKYQNKNIKEKKTLNKFIELKID